MVAKNSSYKLTDQEINASFSENALKMMRKRFLLQKEDGSQETPVEMMRRISRALAEVERDYGASDAAMHQTEQDFFEVMARKEFTPAGRTITNAGAPTALVANCIVLPIRDSMDSIFQTLKDAALLQQAGSGLGFAFSELRPAGMPTKRSRGVSSGPISFLEVYNQAFGVIKQQGRHGANMAIFRVDHPDILDFINCKRVEGKIRNFNISVALTDEFMEAVANRPDELWLANWRGEKMKPHKVLRAKNGSVTGYEEIDITAKELFDLIIDAAWTNGEPGTFFIDTANRFNPLPRFSDIKATNPCGEQPLGAYDVCNLGSINLAALANGREIDWNRLAFVTRTAIRMLDNVIDRSNFPVAKVTETMKANRRIGLGIMGFADLLYQLNVKYNSPEGFVFGEKVMAFIQKESEKMSEELAEKKGVFPNYNLSVFSDRGVKRRNAALTTVAPTGSISMMLDTSSGIEPNFALLYTKQDKDGHQYHYFNKYFRQALREQGINLEKLEEELVKTGSIQHLDWLPKALKDTFVVSMDMSAEDHIGIQAAFQKNVDTSISKTINFPNSATREDVARGYILAWKSGCKGCTVYREGSRTVQILNLGNGENIISPTELGEGMEKATAKALEKLVKETPKFSPKPRPEVLTGQTYKVKTGYGNLYVTINNDENGEPFEIFATIGKSGGFFQEQSEGICRLISLALRAGVSVDDIIQDLKGIRGPMPVMTNKGTVLSLPDAIGQILEEHMKYLRGEIPKLEAAKTETLEEHMNKEMPVAVPAAVKTFSKKKSIADFGMMPGCPECGNLLEMAEGCMSCKACGFSRCI
ncbi:MAG: adenosylcobalamin-dependent ribonucleoside-diphosphate reductase [Candidatus Harrisonbacteria bacterium]|nr:adenosylcobalamin-dependent ribonucleoside-diphosphate reductase [Candidatus Harrisonbacteria bacterium]